jgi:thymidylate kinase
VTISFSGIDGAGKSTQIARLSAVLRRQGLRVGLITFWDEIATLKRSREGAGKKLFKGDSGVGSPSAPIERRDKNVQTPIMTGVRLCLYLLDALSMRCAFAKAHRSGIDVVIFDRYTYDELANLNLRNPFLRAYARLLMQVVPRPTLSLVLDADPLQARARKPEYPLDFLHTNRRAYIELSELLGGITVIAPKSIQEAAEEILAYAMNAVPSAQARIANVDNAAPRAGSNEKSQLERPPARPAAT